MKGFTIIILLFVLYSTVQSTCPDPSHIPGCTCEEEDHHGEVTCKDMTGDKLKAMLAGLNKKDNSEKHIHHLILTGDKCDQLVADTFHDVIVDSLEVKDAPNFKAIHDNALSDINKVLEDLILKNLPSLDVSNLFKIIGNLRGVEMIELIDLAKLEAIPSEAFKPHRKLYDLEIKGKNIKSIGEKAFWNLNQLSHLVITDTSIEKIGDNVFVFSKPSDHYLTIILANNQKLPCTGYSPGAFTNTGRPTELDFSGYHLDDEVYVKQMTCLPEKVFKPFLNKHEDNDIDMHELNFDCKNCDNAWVKKLSEDMLDRIYGIECTGGKEVTDKSLFKECK